MAEKSKAYRISAEQLVSRTKERPIIPLSLSLDIGLSGGVPMGCSVLVGGKPKVGKTSICLQFGANAQQLYGSKIFFFNIEGRITSKVLAQIRGLKLDQDSFEIIMPPPITDSDGDILGHEKGTSEFWWEEIGQVIKNNPRSIIIVDSISQLCSEKEESEGIGYEDRGKAKKIESSFARVYGDLIVQNQVTVFLLAQVIANTSGYGSPMTMKVGNAIKHMADTILFFKTVAKWPESNGRVLGHDIAATIEESALGAPHIDVNIPLRYGYGIDKEMDCARYASNFDIIAKNSAWYVLPFHEVEGKIIFQKINSDGIPVDDNGNMVDQLGRRIKLNPAKNHCLVDDEGKWIDKEGNKSTKPVQSEFAFSMIKLQGEESLRNWLIDHPEQSQELEKQVRKLIFG
jgi:RecA/RadA recombinase